ncbi:uncharacterized protein LOC123007519 [Tribolium madens]|uniref:uncharacterized protein LOC123007519 n=1 Tax=Tribolium madens TaxID=41895 RepID=UPI001CF75D03|nr:uncharacterized protein LOC123007519 [Tribolium madens]
MFVKLAFFVLAVLILHSSASPSRVRRQGFSWGDVDDNDLRPRPRPTTQAPRPRPTTQAPRPRPTTRTTQAGGGTTTTTPSPAYSACIRQCPTTPQYNPICGNNGVTYPNESHLSCANRCGLSVQRAFGGTCQPL